MLLESIRLVIGQLSAQNIVVNFRRCIVYFRKENVIVNRLHT